MTATGAARAHSPLLGTVVTTALALLAFGSDHPSVVTIESADGAKSFGSTFAADGPWIVMVDHIGRGRRGPRTILRFGRVDGDRLIETEEFHSNVLAVDLAHDTAVVRAVETLGEESLVFFKRSGDSWIRDQELEVSPDCRGRYRFHVDLGEDVLVIDADMAARLCVYVREGNRWSPSTILTGADTGGVSRDRVVDLHEDRIDLYARSNRGWERIRTIDPPAGMQFSRGPLATSDRWILARNGHRPYRVYVYDADTGTLAATLQSQIEEDDTFATWLAASDSQIVTIGEPDQVWLFSDGAWRPRGSLDRAKKTALPFNRHAAIADLIWIGNPAIESERSSCGGTVLGFRVD